MPINIISDQKIQIQLQISNVQESDLTKTINLVIENEIGLKNFPIILTLQQKSTTESPSGESGYGLTTTTIIIIILICILVVVISTGIGIYFCKRKQILCFKNFE